LRAALRPGADDAALHGARKAAKRARYAAEAAAPVLGRKAAKARIARFRAVQEVLGEHQDSLVAADLLRRMGAVAGTTPGQNGFTYGLLYAREQQLASAARRDAASLPT
jgi:CHAD domain-containing protein